MANTLTNLIPDVYAALDVVSRELVGFIPSVTIDPQVARVAVGELVRSPYTGAEIVSDVTPGVTPPNDGDNVVNNRSMTISKSRRVPIRFNGEEVKGLSNGIGVLTIKQQRIAQAIRALVNEMEADLAALYKTTARAYGTAGTTPFGTAGDYTDVAQIRKILVDNGSPTSDLQLVLNTNAGANIRGKQGQAYMYGSDILQRQGVLQDMSGMQIRESAQVKNVVKGTGAGYLVNNVAGYAVGSTAIAADTGTGTLLAGDIVTFAGDSNKYVNMTALSAGSFALNDPGLLATLADNTAITIGNNYAANMAFSRSAIVLSTRAPALPDEGDMAADRFMITDPHSGISFEIAMYLQYRQVQYEISCAWGVQNFKPNHSAILLG